MNSKQKGDIAELEVMLYLEKNGYTVLTPFGDKARYDIVSEKNTNFERIQVKYVSLKNGILNVPLESNTKLNGRFMKHKYSKNEIDSIIVYCPDDNNLYKINSEEFKNKTAISLRILSQKNNQIKNINFAINYLL